MDCPAEQTLRRLALGSLPTLEHQKVTDHLRNCSTCATLLRQFQDFPPPPADTVQTTLGSYGPAGPAAEAPPEVEGYALERALGEGAWESSTSAATPASTGPSPSRSSANR